MKRFVGLGARPVVGILNRRVRIRRPGELGTTVGRVVSDGQRWTHPSQVGDFRVVNGELPDLDAGEVLVRVDTVRGTRAVSEWFVARRRDLQEVA